VKDTLPPIWYIISPGAAARSTLERPSRDWKRDRRNTGMPERGGWWEVNYSRAYMGQSPPDPLGGDHRSCWWRRPCISR